MTYQKLTVDNVKCRRRFHIAFDDADPSEKVALRCPHCEVLVFARDSHPPAKLIRDENLLVNTALSNLRVRDCEFEDSFSPPPEPKV